MYVAIHTHTVYNSLSSFAIRTSALLGRFTLYLSLLGINLSSNSSMLSYTSSGVKRILTDVEDCPGGMEPVYVMFGRSTPTAVDVEK